MNYILMSLFLRAKKYTNYVFLMRSSFKSKSTLIGS